MFVGIVMDSVGPTLTLRIEDYDVSDNMKGLIFGIQPTTFVVSVFLGPYLLMAWVPHRVTLITSLFLASVSVFLQAPIFEEKNLTSMLVGLAMSGFPCGMLVIPNLPEMLAGALELYPDCDLELTNSLLSGMLNAFFGIGQAIGPILGCLLNQVIGFRLMMITIGSLTGAYAFVFIFCAQGCQAFRLCCLNYRNRHRQASVESLKLEQQTAVKFSTMFKVGVAMRRPGSNDDKPRSASAFHLANNFAKRDPLLQKVCEAAAEDGFYSEEAHSLKPMSQVSNSMNTEPIMSIESREESDVRIEGCEPASFDDRLIASRQID